MSVSVERQNAVSTLLTAVGWLADYPVLVGLFFLLAVLSAGLQLVPLAGVVGSLAGLLCSAVAHLYAADIVAGRQPALGDHAGTAVGRLLSLIGIALVTAVAVGLGTLLLVVPGIYLAVRLSLAPVACVVDGEGAVDSLATSWEDAQGNLLKLFGITLATGLVSLTALAAVVVAGGFVDPIVQQDRTALFTVLLVVSPISAVVNPVNQLAHARVYLESRGATDDPDEDLTVQPGDPGWGEA